MPREYTNEEAKLLIELQNEAEEAKALFRNDAFGYAPEGFKTPDQYAKAEYDFYNRVSKWLKDHLDGRLPKQQDKKKIWI